MAKKTAEPVAIAVTADRAQRLFRMLHLLGQSSQTRVTLTRKLRLAIRGFYRDLEILRGVGIHVKLKDGRYSLIDDLAVALNRLPFPDPSLTLGEARQLARGRLPVHRKIKSLLMKIEK
jgi:predicted DNA-binding transcriptional regulator YafY